jgi:peptidoglycan-associated lipoprotein
MEALMKNGIVLALFATVAIAGCSKDKPATTPKTVKTDTATPAATKSDDKAPVVKDDQKVSQGLALSSDIAEACGIKADPTADPKFDYDKDELSPADRKVLDQVAVCLTTGALKGKNVTLIGRADPRGTEEYNLGLGSRRSNTVGSYLTRSGVAQTQLGATTRGAIDATGTDEASWAKDRRVDIQMTKPVESAKAE